MKDIYRSIVVSCGWGSPALAAEVGSAEERTVMWEVTRTDIKKDEYLGRRTAAESRRSGEGRRIRGEEGWGC